MIRLPFISIVCLNWNSCEDILKLLASIKTSYYPKEKCEVIVVDNASIDDSIQKIKKNFPRTKIVSLSKNIGMPALNEGYKRAKGEIICSIQSDVTIAKDFLRKVVEKMQSDKDIGLLGVKVFDKKTHKILPPTIRFNFYTGVISPKFYDHETSDFDYLEGLVHVFPKEVLKKVGFIDPKYFFYGDDPDFCFRLKRMGLKMVYFPKTWVYHGKSKSSPKVFPMKYHHYYKAAFRIVYTYGNILQKISTIILQLTIIPLYLLITKKKNTFHQRLWGFWWNIKNAHLYTMIFLVSLLIGIMLRLYALYTQDFWFDEAFTYHVAKLPLSLLVNTVLTDNNPPLYYILIHYVLKINYHEVLIRMPSFVFNIGTIYFLFKLLDEHIGKKVALVAASLFAISPLAIYLSSTARLHSMAIFLLVFLTWLFFKLTKNPKLSTIIIFILFSIIGIYTQYYIALIFVPFTLFIIKKRQELSFRHWLIIVIMIATIFSPWLLIASQTLHNGCSCPNTLLSLPATLVSPILGGVGETSLRSFVTLPLYYLLLFSTVAIFHFLLFLKGIMQYKKITLLYIFPLSILGLLGIFIPVFSPKGFAIFSPIFFAIIALGLLSFQPPKRYLTLISFILIGIISLVQFINPFFSGIPLKRMLPIIKKHENASLAHTSLISYYSMRYYTQDKHMNILLTKNLLPDDAVKNIGGHTEKIDKRTDRFWLIDTDKWVDQNDRNETLEYIHKNFIQIEHHKFGSASVSYFVQSPISK